MTQPDLDNPEYLAALRRDMLRFAELQLRDRAAAEDAVQEALAAALTHRQEFESRASLRTWVLSILRNKIIDAFRERSRTTAVPEEAAAATEGADWAVAGYFDGRGHWDGDTRPAEWGDPVMAFESSRFWEVFEACLYRLPENTARVFLMREVIGFETPEICQTLAVTSNNCWVLLHRARLQLRACLGEKWFGEGAAA